MCLTGFSKHTLKENDITENVLGWSLGGRGSKVTSASYQLRTAKAWHFLHFRSWIQDSKVSLRAKRKPHVAKVKDTNSNHCGLLFIENREQNQVITPHPGFFGDTKNEPSILNAIKQ